MTHPWTPKDDETLKKLAPHYLPSVISKKMGFAQSTVKRHAKALGVQLLRGYWGHQKPLSADEEDFIMESHPRLGYSEIARQLGRPTPGVISTHKRLLREAREKEAAKEAQKKREEKNRKEEARRFPRTKYGYSGLLRANT